MSQTQEITLLNKSVRLLQPEGGFRPGLDSVMLAAACPAIAKETVLDAGCGVGSAGLCLKHRVPDIQLRGVDSDQIYIDLARQNGKTSSFDCVSIQNYRPEHCFDHIICNPPFYEDGEHLMSPDFLKAKAHGHGVDHEDIDLEVWIKHIHRLLKSKGGLTMIHRTERLDDILFYMRKKFGAVEIIPLWRKVDGEAKRVIIRAIKDRKTALKIHAGLALHEEDGSYTKEADKILKDGEGLFL